MKSKLFASTLALVYIPQVLTQSLTVPVSTSTSVVEVYDASCSEIDQVTDYSTITITTCPACTEHPGPITKHTTVYTTTYASLCETGWVPYPHVITETCTGATPAWSSGPNYIPPGFTETITLCTVCGGKPTKVTLTIPCEETGNGGAASPPKPPGAPAQQTPPTVNIPGYPPAGDSNGGPRLAAPPYPTGANSTLVKCPGSPHCHGAGSSAPSGGAGGPGPGAANPQSPGGAKPESPINSAVIATVDWARIATAFLLVTINAAIWL